MADSKKKKLKVKNRKKFARSIFVFILFIAIIVGIIFGGDFLLKRMKAQYKPLGDDDYNTSGGAVETSGGAIDEKDPEKDAEMERVFRLAKEVGDAKTKIETDKYPIETVEDFDLLLINKTHALSENYYPEDLVKIDRFVSGVGSDETHQMRKVAADALNAMFDAAAEEGLEIRLRTGFRSYSYQTSLYNNYVKRDGQKAADTYSARPGTSEHQTGLSCDLGGKSEGFELSYKFGKTDEGKWVAEHAHEFGFIIRYTDGEQKESGKGAPGKITGYVYEPWHIRYVGVEHATEIYNAGITLEEYLGILD